MKPALLFLLSFTFLTGATRADWQNGQNANLVLGQSDLLSGNAGTSAAELNEVQDMAIDPTTGNVFVCDKNNNRVLKFASLATLTNGASAIGVLGQSDFVTGTGANPPHGSLDAVPAGNRLRQLRNPLGG